MAEQTKKLVVRKLDTDDLMDKLNKAFATVLRSAVPAQLFGSKELDLARTPSRMAKMFAHEILSGYSVEAQTELDETFRLFPVDEAHQELVMLRNIPYYSMCSHHMVPFFGVCHVGYLPGAHLVGLSKIPRVVNHFARRLQVQERLVGEIADYLFERLEPEALMVSMSGRHMCMELRGVRAHGVDTVTTAIRGTLTPDLKAEFYQNIKGPQGS